MPSTRPAAIAADACMASNSDASAVPAPYGGALRSCFAMVRIRCSLSGGASRPSAHQRPRMILVGPGDCDQFLPTQCRPDAWQRRSASPLLSVSVRSSPVRTAYREISPPMRRLSRGHPYRRSGLPSRRRMHYACEESGCGVAWRNGIDGRVAATRRLGEAAHHTARLRIG
jgi:hypothetical protein